MTPDGWLNRNPYKKGLKVAGEGALCIETSNAKASIFMLILVGFGGNPGSCKLMRNSCNVMRNYRANLWADNWIFSQYLQ